MNSSSIQTSRNLRPRRIVVKLGTGVLTTGIGKLDTQRIKAVCAQIATLRKLGTEVLIVSSGAVGLGMGRLGLKRRPTTVTKKQACAAVGQSLLMQTWQEGFTPHNLNVAQVLLTHDDLRNRERHLGVKATLEALLGYDTIPVINENDTVSATEIQAMLNFGDNDTLSALVASLVHAEYLIILSTAPGLIDYKSGGQIVPVVEKITREIEALAGGTKSETAVGGMVSKIAAAKLAGRAGCGVFIASGAEPDVIARLLSGQGPGTFFAPSGLPMEAKKRWLAYFQRPSGTLFVNACAVPVLQEKGRSLLAVGVTHATGEFAAGDIVNVAGPDGTVIARGKTTYTHLQIPEISGKKGEAMATLFPQRKRHEIIHRNDLALL
jgi:glutamate 5-kinase|uniref:glutamate 5-kinase n=1 Tax=Cephaloticoccus sp. TaxID=1985742 RepID=UPI0040495999